MPSETFDAVSIPLLDDPVTLANWELPQDTRSNAYRTNAFSGAVQYEEQVLLLLLHDGLDMVGRNVGVSAFTRFPQFYLCWMRIN